MIFSKNPVRTTEYVVLATAALVTLITLVWLLARGHHGMDLTDESYYLIWMSNPWLYSISTTQFGFIYHPLYLLLHGDIALLRQANILIIFVLSWMLCAVFFRATLDSQEHNLSWRSVPMLALAAVTATCSLIYFTTYGWLATPSYNSLVFQALIIASIGLLLAEKTSSSVSIAGWILIGIGGWLVFMAKPSSAMVFAAVVSVYLPLAGKFNFRLFSISGLTAITLLLISAWTIDGSPVIFFDRLKSGIEVLKLLNAGHIDMFRIDTPLMGRKEQILLAFSSLTSFVTIYLMASEKKILIKAGLGFTSLFAISSLVIISDYFVFQSSDPYTTQLTLLILAIPLSSLAFFLVTIRMPFSNMVRNRCVIVLYFAVLPHISAFGSANNYWLQGSLGGLFWVLAGLAILIPTVASGGTQRILLPAVVGGQLITIFLLYAAMERPYFLQPEPFREYEDIVTIGTNESELILPKYFADFYRNVKKMASQAGFQSGIPVIDMTGHGSGVLYAIGAKSVGQPWMIGGYSGSDNVAIFTLNRVSCAELVESWLLVEPDGLVRLSPAILNNFGISFEQRFEMVAELNMPLTNTDHHGMPSHRLQLWKPLPLPQDAIATCEQKRNQH
jgi:hypothetical protein